jgi:hypothetical protein
MSIIQISKIQQRSGELVDLPQLDEAEFGFATDEKRLFIGKTIGSNENVEVLTAYSEIAFNQIDGAIGNLDIQTNVANGQVLTYDGNNWVNRGGDAGGYISLGDASNVSITGGSLGYQLVTDGEGHLSWSPKGFVTLNILNVSQADPGVITFTAPFPVTSATQVTINDIQGNTGFTALNATDFFLKPIAGNTSAYELYQDSLLTVKYDTSAFDPAFPFTNVVKTLSDTNEVEVGNSTSFANNIPILFYGDLGNSGIIANTTYYVYDVPDSTHIIISTSDDGNTSNVVELTNETVITANVYNSSGLVSIAIGGGAAGAGGSNTQVQFNNDDVLAGDDGLTYDYLTQTLAADNILTNNIFAVEANTANLTVGNLTLGTFANLGSNANITISGGSPTQVLTTDGFGNLYWSNGGNGGGNAWPGYYLHTQGTANTTWTVVHNLNTEYVDVTPIFANNESIVGHYNFPTVDYINANAFTLTFSSALTGYVAVAGDQGNIEGYYLHTQALSSNTWTVNHYLGSQFVAVTPVFANNESYLGTYDFPTITYNNANSLTLTFSSSTTGKVAVVGSSNIPGYYVHTELGASNVWTVNHNLGSKYLSVTPIDTSNVSYLGRYDYPNVIFNSSNTCTLTFSTPVSGRVVVVGGAGTEQSAGGSNTEVQFNNGGVLDGDSTFTFNSTSKVTTIGNANITLGNITTANVNDAVITTANITNANITTANITTANITNTFTTSLSTGATATPGTIVGDWSLSGGSRLTATYADLAEYYAADKQYGPGTVLEFGGDEEVTIAKDESNKLAGVVSSEPAYVMNGNIQAEHPVMLALIGRVKVKVIGWVSKGDMLVSAGNGYAKTNIMSPKIGTVIGKAIESKADSGEGFVEVLVGRM